MSIGRSNGKGSFQGKRVGPPSSRTPALRPTTPNIKASKSFLGRGTSSFVSRHRSLPPHQRRAFAMVPGSSKNSRRAADAPASEGSANFLVRWVEDLGKAVAFLPVRFLYHHGLRQKLFAAAVGIGVPLKMAQLFITQQIHDWSTAGKALAAIAGAFAVPYFASTVKNIANRFRENTTHQAPQYTGQFEVTSAYGRAPIYTETIPEMRQFESANGGRYTFHKAMDLLFNHPKKWLAWGAIAGTALVLNPFIFAAVQGSYEAIGAGIRSVISNYLYLPEVFVPLLASINITLFRYFLRMPSAFLDGIYQWGRANPKKGVIAALGLTWLASDSLWNYALGDVLGLTGVIEGLRYNLGYALNGFNWLVAWPLWEAAIGLDKRTARSSRVRRFQFQPFRRVMKFCEKYGFFVGTPLAITWGWINGHILARLTGIVGTSPTFVPKALAEHMRNLPAGENLPSLVNDLQEMAVKPGFSGFWLLSFLLLGPAIFYGLSGRGREKPAEKWYEHNLWGLVRKKIGRPLKWGGVALSVPVIYTGINGMFGAPWFLDLYNWFALSRANGLVFTLSTVISTVGLWLAAGGIEGVYGHNFFKPLTEIPGWFRRNVWLFSSPPVIPRKNQVYLEPSADIVTYGFGTRNPRPNLPPLMDVIRPKSPEEKPRAEGPAPAATTEASEAPPAQDENQGRPVEES